MKPLDQLAAEALAGPPVVSLDSAKGVEEVTGADVKAAEQAAAKAEAEAADAERQAVLGAIDADDAASTRERARFTRLRAQLTAKRAERSAAAKRIHGLGKVAEDIDRLAVKAASGPSSAFEQAARTLAEAAEAMRAVCAEHDRAVQDLADRAIRLKVEDPAPTGPRASSAFVAVKRDMYARPSGLIHGRREVVMIGGTVNDAVIQAAQGDVGKALELVTAVNEQPEAVRPEHMFIRTTDGMTFAGTPEQHEYALAEGLLRPMTKRELDVYMEGKFDGFTS